MKKLALVLLLVLAAACSKSRGMETKTFTLSRLTQDEVLALLTPYIHEGGYLSAKNKLVTVRDKPERLKLIEDILKQYDGAGEAVDVVLTMQVIEADGFKERDPEIADVESTLREMFKYNGYRLIGSVRIQTREDEMFEQRGEDFAIQGRVARVRGKAGDQSVAVDVRLAMRAGKNETPLELQSTVTAPIGKPTVLGQSTSKGAIILVIRPAIAGK